MEKEKITARQANLLVILAAFSVVIRVLPKYCATYAKEGTWLTILLGIIPFLILVKILDDIMLKGKMVSMDNAFEQIVGKLLSKIINWIYIFGLLLFLILQIRLFAEKFTSSIFHKVPLEFFVLTILLSMHIIARNSIKGLGRFAEFTFPLVILFVAIVFILSIDGIKIENLYPVTIYDMPGILKSIYPLMIMGGIITYITFLGNYIEDRHNVKKVSAFNSIFLCLTSTIIVVSTIGTFGYKLTQDLTLPYFMILKNIKILTVIERIESIAITFWAITDFCMIGLLYFVITNLLNKQFKTNNRKNYVAPLTLMVFPLSLMIASNVFELENFIRGYGNAIFIITGVVIPIIIWIIGKVRKKI